MAAAKKNPFRVRTLGDVAAFFGVAPDTVKKWRSRPNGMPGTPGNWRLDEIAQWKVARMGDLKPHDEKRDELEMRRLEIDVESKQLALQKKAGGLVDRAAAIATIAEMFNRVKVRLECSPYDMASRAPQAIRAEMVAEFRLILKEFESW